MAQVLIDIYLKMQETSECFKCTLYDRSKNAKERTTYKKKKFDLATLI